LVFAGAFRKMIPYWRLIGMSGAEIVPVEPPVEAMIRAADDRCAAAFLFAGSLYERDVPPCEEAVPRLKAAGLTVVVDAAAQLPPASNLWHYTAELGADLAVFSGGKHIRGPQSTGLIVGRKDLVEGCRMSACPNPRVGRAFKTGKEELAGFITALELFVADEGRYRRQQEMLEALRDDLAAAGIGAKLVSEGRLGTEQPLLIASLPDGLSAKAVNDYTRARKQPVDVGVYPPEFGMPENAMFLNAYNLSPDQVGEVGRAVREAVGVLRKRGFPWEKLKTGWRNWASACRNRPDGRGSTSRPRAFWTSSAFRAAARTCPAPPRSRASWGS
jgi:L-seryl-tRNA(Ser) seleniumtransferase